MNKIVFRSDSKYVIDLAYIDSREAQKILDFLELSKSKNWIVTLETEEDSGVEGNNEDKRIMLDK